MEEIMTSKVYVKLDANSLIIHCEGGYTISNIQNIDEWTLVDEGTGDRYNLCQSHYFPGGLFTCDGIPLYRWDGLQAIARAEEEIEADRAALPVPEEAESELSGAELASAIKEGVESV